MAARKLTAPLILRTGLSALLAFSALSASAQAATITVNAGESIQAAIAAANPGDIVDVAAGTFQEDIDFLGKAITVQGQGHTSVIMGSGTGPVVTMDSGETVDSVLDSFTVSGGVAGVGGGIYINGGDPTIVRNVVYGNQAVTQGSGIYVEASSARIYNNLVMYNSNVGGDPHSIEVVDASPLIINNTIVRNDSNAVILRGNSPAVVMNNILALNGSVPGAERRGRGICDFSIGGVAEIQYNLFHRNRRSALLTGGTDYKRISRAQRVIAPPRLEGNTDGKPNYAQRRNPARQGSRRMMETSFDDLVAGLELSTTAKRQRATDAGNPDPAFNDLDGSRNDTGFTGGPFAAP